VALPLVQQVRLLQTLAAVGLPRREQTAGHAGFGPPPPAVARRRERHIDRFDHVGDAALEGLIIILAIALVLLIAAQLVRPFAGMVTIHDYQRGLRYRRGRFSGLVDPGTHFVARPFSEIFVLDGRPAFMVIDGQEILTSDVVPLRVSLAARYVIGDPVAAVTGDQNYAVALRLELQLGLRDALAGRTADEILGNRATIGPAVFDRTASKLARIGIELLAVEARDLMVSGELKRAFAGVITARKEGEAALERARGETASLRHLANAGRIVEDNPGLLQLRLLQQLGTSPGSSVVLTMPDGTGAGGAPVAGTASPSQRAARSRGRPSPPETETK
jgi:regulator of protease activity HflC (stomatin/prohibitin superfamily)